MEWRLELSVLLETKLFLSVNRVGGPFSGKGLEVWNRDIFGNVAIRKSKALLSHMVFGIPRRENQPYWLKK